MVIAIISLLTALTLPNWRSGARSLALERSAFKLGQDVRRAEELALRAQAFECETGSITGYGVAFDLYNPTTYLLFAECNGDNTYSSQDSIVDTITLESDTVISSLVPGPQSSVVFIPPTPRIFINPGGLEELQVQLTTTGGASKSVTITHKGIIDIE